MKVWILFKFGFRSKSKSLDFLRKTRAMNLYENGMPLSHIQQLLGHEDMSTTSGFYAFATLDTLAKSMNAANKNTSTEGKRWNDKGILKKIYKL